jgi:hypothetical protein
VKKLDSADFQDRERGTRECILLGRAALPILRQDASKETRAEVKIRLEEIISFLSTGCNKAIHEEVRRLVSDLRAGGEGAQDAERKLYNLCGSNYSAAHYLLDVLFDQDDEEIQAKFYKIASFASDPDYLFERIDRVINIKDEQTRGALLRTMCMTRNRNLGYVLLGMLKSGDPHTWVDIIQEICHLKRDDCNSALIDHVLSAGDFQLVYRVLSYVNPESTRRRLDDIIACFRKSNSSEFRKALASWIGTVDDDEATSFLQSIVLEHPDDPAAEDAVDGLGWPETKKRYDILKNIVAQTKNDNLKIEALRVVARFRNEQSQAIVRQNTDFLMREVENGNAQKFAILNMLTCIGNAKARDMLRTALLKNEGDSKIDPIYEIADVGLLQDLFSALKEDHRRQDVIFALGNCEDLRAIDVLCDIFRKTDSDNVRHTVMLALLRKNNPAASQKIWELIANTEAVPQDYSLDEILQQWRKSGYFSVVRKIQSEWLAKKRIDDKAMLHCASLVGGPWAIKYLSSLIVSRGDDADPVTSILGGRPTNIRPDEFTLLIKDLWEKHKTDESSRYVLCALAELDPQYAASQFLELMNRKDFDPEILHSLARTLFEMSEQRTWLYSEIDPVYTKDEKTLTCQLNANMLAEFSQWLAENREYLLWSESLRCIIVERAARDAGVNSYVWQYIPNELTSKWSQLDVAGRKDAIATAAKMKDADDKEKARAWKAGLPFEIWKLLENKDKEKWDSLPEDKQQQLILDAVAKARREHQ